MAKKWIHCEIYMHKLLPHAPRQDFKNFNLHSTILMVDTLSMWIFHTTLRMHNMLHICLSMISKRNGKNWLWFFRSLMLIANTQFFRHKWQHTKISRSPIHILGHALVRRVINKKIPACVCVYAFLRHSLIRKNTARINCGQCIWTFFYTPPASQFALTTAQYMKHCLWFMMVRIGSESNKHKLKSILE